MVSTGIVKWCFELKNVPATFQLPMDVIRATVTLQSAIIYIDDVTILFKSPEEPVKHIKEVLGLRMATEIIRKQKKCHFFSKSIDKLGHVTAPGKLHVSKTTAKMIESL